MTKIHLLTITPMGILVVYRDRLWQFRVLSNGSIYGQAREYYTPQLAEEAGREWVGRWK
jgi:hypothetical protein